MVKVSLGGDKHGVLTLVIGNEKFLKETEKEWLVPESHEAFPTIAANASAINEKKAISNFIQDKKDILIVEVAK